MRMLRFLGWGGRALSHNTGTIKVKPGAVWPRHLMNADKIVIANSATECEWFSTFFENEFVSRVKRRYQAAVWPAPTINLLTAFLLAPISRVTARMELPS
jgi:hypothetical protein